MATLPPTPSVVDTRTESRATFAYRAVDLDGRESNGNMAAANAKTMTASAAVAKAMEDAPCAMCKVAASARQAAEQAPLGKQEAAKSKVKPDGAVWSVRLPACDLGRAESFREVTVSVFCPELICEVPVPPPKAAA